MSCVAQEVVQDLPDALRVTIQVNLTGRVHVDVYRRRELSGELDRGRGQRHEVELLTG